MAEQIIKGNLALICRAMFNHNDNLCSMLSNKSGSKRLLMKGNLFLILQYVSVLNAEDFFKHDTAGMCYTIYPRDDEEKSCIKIGVSCFNCPFIYLLDDSNLYKTVRDYK